MELESEVGKGSAFIFYIKNFNQRKRKISLLMRYNSKKSENEKYWDCCSINSLNKSNL